MTQQYPTQPSLPEWEPESDLMKIKPPSKLVPLGIAGAIMTVAALMGLWAAAGDASHYNGGVYITYPVASVMMSLPLAIPTALAWYLLSRSFYRGRTGARIFMARRHAAVVTRGRNAELDKLAEQAQKDPWLARYVDLLNQGDEIMAAEVLMQARNAGLIITDFDIKEYVGRQMRQGRMGGL